MRLEKLVRSARSVVGRLVLSLDVFASDEGKGTTLFFLEGEDTEGVSTAIAMLNSSFLTEGE